MRRRALTAVALALLLAACASPPDRPALADRPADPRGAQVVLAALSFLDTPYRRGGHSAQTGFDCSGFTRHVFGESVGVTLPRTADEQAAAPALADVDRDALQPGDLVFFNTLGRTFSHVGIVVGDGRFVHAPRSGAQVRVENLGAPYWARRYTGARRLAANP